MTFAEFADTRMHFQIMLQVFGRASAAYGLLLSLYLRFNAALLAAFV